MNFLGSSTQPPPPPINPDPKANQRAFEEDLKNNQGLTQDLALLTSWIWRALTWPIRAIHRRAKPGEG